MTTRLERLTKLAGSDTELLNIIIKHCKPDPKPPKPWKTEEEKKECARAYRLANKEKAKAYRIQYMAINRDKVLAQRRLYNEANKAKAVKYREEHREELKAKGLKYRIANAEKLSVKASKYYMANADKIKAKRIERKRMKLGKPVKLTTLMSTTKRSFAIPENS